MIDDKYLSGVWYDMEAGDYCRIAVNNADELVLRTPFEGDEYYTFAATDEFDPVDFRPVPEEAVEDPVSYLTKMLNFCQSNKQLYREEEVGLGYARQAVEIKEA